jgi:hypothetical protein
MFVDVDRSVNPRAVERAYGVAPVWRVPWETYTVLAATEEFGARADDDCARCET